MTQPKRELTPEERAAALVQLRERQHLFDDALGELTDAAVEALMLGGPPAMVAETIGILFGQRLEKELSTGDQLETSQSMVGYAVVKLAEFVLLQVAIK